MSSISTISKALKTHLTKPNSDFVVELKDPTEGFQGNVVSVWLYQILPDEFSRNASSPILNEAVSNGTGSLSKRKRSAAPPLGVNLYYLITPLTGAVDSDHDELGRLLLTIHESPVLRVVQPDLGEDELIRISLPADPLEERLHLWDSLKATKYRLSFICLLRTARLFTANTVEEAPVVGLTTKPSREFPRN